MTPQDRGRLQPKPSRPLTPQVCKEVDVVIAAIELGNAELDFPNVGSILAAYRRERNRRFAEKRVQDAHERDVACVERLLGIFKEDPDSVVPLLEAQLLRCLRGLESSSRDLTENLPEEILNMFDTRDAAYELREMLRALRETTDDIDDRIAVVDDRFRAQETWLKGLADPFYDHRISEMPTEYWWWRLMRS